MRNILIQSLLILYCCTALHAQQFTKIDKQTIKWTGVKKIKVNETDSSSFVSFAGAVYSKNLPYFYEKKAVTGDYNYSVILHDQVFVECSAEEAKLIPLKEIGNNIVVSSPVAKEKRVPYACISFLPIRKNSVTGKLEKLVSFNIEIVQGQAKPKGGVKKTWATSSVLSSGKWYKIAVPSDGIYKLTYNDLVSLGMDVANLNPKNIRIYGNGGGMLSENNFDKRYDDLTENPIYVSGEADGVFDNTDYILFYGSGPIKWKFSTGDSMFHHQQNYYSDATYYFITADQGTGAKRILQQPSSSTPANKVITKFNDYLYHEKDSTNLIKSGKEWYGENFDILTSYSFGFTFPNIDASTKVRMKTAVASACSSTSVYTINANGNVQNLVDPHPISPSDNYVLATEVSSILNFAPNSSTINVSVTKATSNAVGWLNYIELNAMRHLTLSGSQLQFRSLASLGTGNVSQFKVANGAVNGRIWDVTDPVNVKEQQFSTSSDTAVFNIATDSLREFVAFNGSGYFTPTLIGAIPNQNLHGLNEADFIIVAYPDFVSQANSLANIHSTNDSLTSVIVTPSQIYNEFSSGAQDITAIRDFVKMFYDRAAGTPAAAPKYLLLFGNASYDYKNRMPDNMNFVPTYESPNGLDETASYSSDDYYGFLDDTDGPYTAELLDIGIGRFPVKTTDEASTMINKIVRYLAKNNPNSVSTGCSNYASSVSGDWRNMVCFVADDEEYNDFLTSSEARANYVDTLFKDYNLDKIYCDAYVQQSGAGGQRYPDVNDAINKRVEKGALIINYIGHGGEVGWALERILQISDIESWTNINNMPLFVTATCEFSRYDDPARVAAGELVLLNANGGGIALLTTSRLAYTSSNDNLTTNFYQNVFKTNNGVYYTLGELNRISKNGTGSTVDTYIRNFVLLGDPALRLSYPINNVVTTSINGHPAGSTVETLKAFSKVTVAGEIQDQSGNKLTDFNGIVYPTVYDKKTLTHTLGNDPTSPIANFYIQKSILYKGKASVTNGNFSFTFIVPKDIAYNYGEGKISYYAEDAETNANGYYEGSKFIIGGSDSSVAIDRVGPKISLYMNDSTFVYGGLTNEKPLLLAYVSDSSGINTVGNGIGHDIVAVLDGNTAQSIVLNDYYQAALNSYQKGVIKYPFSNLADGTHTLKLKVWDIYNNSSEANTEFIVAQSAQLSLDHVLNYPNPFTTHTSFLFEHNHPCCSLQVQIQIFTITGRLIKTIDQVVQTIGYRAEPIDWDGLDDYGDPIARGVYIYKLKVKSDDGSTAQKTEKLVILR